MVVNSEHARSLGQITHLQRHHRSLLSGERRWQESSEHTGERGDPRPQPEAIRAALGNHRRTGTGFNAIRFDGANSIAPLRGALSSVTST